MTVPHPNVQRAFRPAGMILDANNLLNHRETSGNCVRQWTGKVETQ